MKRQRMESRSAVAPAPLRQRLARLSAEASEILCALHVQHRRWAFDDGDPFWFEATVAPRRVCAQRVAIVVDGRAGELALHHAQPSTSIGELHWSDYAGTAGLTAWTLSHRRAMTCLARVFRGIVLPQALLDDDAEEAAGLVTLGFRLGRGEETSDEGVLRVAPAIARRLLAHAGTGSCARSPVALASLPVRVRIGLAGPTLAASDLRGLEAGDVIVLGTRTQALSRLDVRIVGDGHVGAWQASWQPGHVRIDTPLDPSIDSLRSPTMTDSDDPVPAAAEDAGAPADPLAQLPVRIDFTIGELELPLAKLSQLEPGYVFTLTSNLDDARIGIRANGRRVGSGRLVAIGETLGVQLEGWESDGLQ